MAAVELSTVAARREVKLLEKEVLKLGRGVDHLDTEIAELTRVLALHTSTGKRMGMMMRSNAAQARIVAKATADQKRRFNELGREMQIVMQSAKPLTRDFSNLGIQMERVMRAAAPLKRNFSNVGRQMQIMMRSQKGAADGFGKVNKKGFVTRDMLNDVASSP